MTTPPNSPGQGQPSGTFGQGGQYPYSGSSSQSEADSHARHSSSASQQSTPQPGYGSGSGQQVPNRPEQPGQPGFNYYVPQRPNQPAVRLRQGPQFRSSTAGPGPQRKPTDPVVIKRRRLVVLIVIAVLVLGIGTYLVVSRSASRASQHQAEAAMTGLLTALQSGDVAEALDYLDVDPSVVDGQPLLTDAAIAGNRESFAFNPTFVTKHSGGIFTQQASIQINDTTRVVEWDARQIDGTWKIDASDVLGQFTLSPGESVLINDIPVGPDAASLKILPGSYTVESALPLLTYAPGQANFDIFTGSQTAINADLIIADGVRERVVDQVREILDACVAEKTSPGTCNWVLVFTNGHALDGTITWTLSPEDPAAGLTIPDTGWRASDSFTQTFPLRYQTSASGNGEMDDGTRGRFEGFSSNRTSYFSLDLSGETPVVKLVS